MTRSELEGEALSMGYRKVFLVGCPRSGTTWLQLLLSQSRQVATAPETHIFSFYLDHFRKQWQTEHSGPSALAGRQSGLSRLLSEKDFLELCGSAAEFVLNRIAARNPGASVVVEKSPQHAPLAPWILRVFPDARLLHMVRDPRDAVVSLMRAGRTWGSGWAPRNPIEAARMWCRHVAGAREAMQQGEGHIEVRYEALREDPVAELRRVLGWLDLDEGEPSALQAVESCQLERLRTQAEMGSLPLPAGRPAAGFFGQGSVGGWREVLTRGEARCVESVCFDLMEEYGYVPEVTGSARLPARVRFHDGLQRMREAIDWRLQLLLQRV